MLLKLLKRVLLLRWHRLLPVHQLALLHLVGGRLLLQGMHLLLTQLVLCLRLMLLELLLRDLLLHLELPLLVVPLAELLVEINLLLGREIVTLRVELLQNGLRLLL